jgi:hypothetical protein
VGKAVVDRDSCEEGRSSVNTVPERKRRAVEQKALIDSVAGASAFGRSAF